jgi:hypothetical protein
MRRHASNSSALTRSFHGLPLRVRRLARSRTSSLVRLALLWSSSVVDPRSLRVVRRAPSQELFKPSLAMESPQLAPMMNNPNCSSDHLKLT